MTYEIRTIDPADEAVLRAWWEVGRDATAERPVDAWPVWEVSRQALPIRRTDGRLLLVGAHEGERTVGAGMVFLFGQDSRHLGEVDVYVAPPERRRGIGRALLAELERLSAAHGRTSLISTAYAPVGGESPGSLFAAALGYPVASAEETKTVDLTTEPEGWGRLDDEVAAALGDYRIEVFDGPVPEEHLDDFCVLLTALLLEVPTGDLDLQQQHWTPARVREFEERAVRIGMVPVVSVAVDPDGRLCGMSDVRVNRHDPRHASVGTTMVQPGHRGHRLGLGMKLASHRRLLGMFPECRYVETGNAGTNAPMNAVHVQMGYRVVERALDVQKRLCDVDIEQINPRNEAALAAWHATVVAADVHGREDTATPWKFPETKAALADQTDIVRLVFAGIEDGRAVVAAGQVQMSLRDHLQHADLGVYVHPDHRRRGHGTRMLEQLETVARGHGRTILNGEASWPYDAPADGAGTPGAEFLTRNGFRFGIGDVMRTLDLPVDDRVLDELAAEAAPHHAAYELRSWVGPVPVELEVGWADLLADLMVEAPTGDMERERESADVEELRRGEALVEAQGRTLYNTVALDGDGWPVAYSNLATSVHDPDNAFQWGTLVRREHRGHRLGLAVKVANLRLFQAADPVATRLRTWNAEVNSHMVGVNERLGFRPVERLGEFQKRLG